MTSQERKELERAVAINYGYVTSYMDQGLNSKRDHDNLAKLESQSNTPFPDYSWMLDGYHEQKANAIDALVRLGKDIEYFVSLHGQSEVYQVIREMKLWPLPQEEGLTTSFPLS